MKILNIFLILFTIVLFSACTEDAPQANLTFSHNADGNEIQPNTTLHSIGANGKLASFSSVQFYISNLRMIKTDGSEFPIDGHFYIDLDNSTIDLGEIDAGSYTDIKFDVGVDSANNHLNIANLPEIDPLSYQDPSMHWGWTGGYRFISLNGNYDADGNGLVEQTDSIFQLHLGNDAYLKEAHVSYSLETQADEVYDLDITVDYSALFNYNIDEFPITKTVMVNTRNTTIANEIPSIFSR